MVSPFPNTEDSPSRNKALRHPKGVHVQRNNTKAFGFTIHFRRDRCKFLQRGKLVIIRDRKTALLFHDYQTPSGKHDNDWGEFSVVWIPFPIYIFSPSSLTQDLAFWPQSVRLIMNINFSRVKWTRSPPSINGPFLSVNRSSPHNRPDSLLFIELWKVPLLHHRFKLYDYKPGEHRKSPFMPRRFSKAVETYPDVMENWIN